jgi:hypothetical protein
MIHTERTGLFFYFVRCHNVNRLYGRVHLLQCRNANASMRRSRVLKLRRRSGSWPEASINAAITYLVTDFEWYRCQHFVPPKRHRAASIGHI